MAQAVVSESVEVSIWSRLGAEWALVGGATYDRVEFEQRHQDVGVWSMSLPHGTQSETVKPGRLVTTKYRDELGTWTVAPLTLTQSDDEDLTRTIGGYDALWMLGWALAYPSPNAPLTQQATEGNYSGPAETVIRSLVTDNLTFQTGLTFDAPPSLGRGLGSTSKPRFDNLLQEVLRVAKRGGIGVRFGLVPTTSDTRARLTLGFYEPADRTARVQLSAADGSLASWEHTESPPSATKAIVGGAGTGAGQYLREVTSPASVADAAAWEGHRVVYVDGPETFDNAPLDEAGLNALSEGAATTTLTMEADEPVGTKAFRSFTVGDKVTAIPVPGLRIPDVVQAIRVVHEDGDPEVSPIFGNPDVGDPDAQTAELIRNLRREVQSVKINRKRGAT